MNAIITYKEISDFIEREYKIRPEFTALDENLTSSMRHPN